MRKIRAGLSATGLVFAATISAPSVLAQDNLTPNGIADDRQNAFAFTNANIYQAYGLDPERALTLITKNNAEILGIDDRIGTLEVGKDATLFISIGDALDMRTSQVLGAYIQGRDIDLFGTQQQLYERFRDKYSKQVE